MSITPTPFGSGGAEDNPDYVTSTSPASGSEGVAEEIDKLGSVERAIENRVVTDEGGVAVIVSAAALGTSGNPVTSPSAARPTGLAVVYWYTATQPTNWLPGDVWDSTTITTVTGAVIGTNNGSDFADAGTTRANLHVPALTPAAAVAVANISSLTGNTAIDGYTPAATDIVLLTAQTTASQNGVWLIPSGGGAWTRPTEFAATAVVHGRTCRVLNGTANGGTDWTLVAPTAGITIGTTSQTWARQVPYPANTAGGDLTGTLPNPTVAKIQGTTIASPSGTTTTYLNGQGAWTTPAGGGSVTYGTTAGTAAQGNDPRFAIRPMILGVSPGSAWEAQFYAMTSGQQATAIALMVSTNVQMIRIDTYWNTTSTTAADTSADVLITAAIGAGIKVLVIIINNTGTAAPTSAASTFQTFCANHATHCNGLGVTSYEIFNEPNSGAMTPAQFTTLLESAYTGIKSSQPNAIVTTCGMAAEATGGSAYAPIDFLAGIYTAGGQNFFDVVNIHPYTFPAMPGELQLYNTFSQQIPALRRLMLEKGDGNKPIWITEYGLPTGTDAGFTAYSVLLQMGSVRQAMRQAAAWGFVPVFLHFSWVDTVGDGDFGLYAAAGSGVAGSAKPVAASFMVGPNPSPPTFGALTAPTVPATTVAYTNAFGIDCTVYVHGGTVTVIAVNGATTGLTSGSFFVAGDDTITITYSSVPTWVWIGAR